MRLSPGEDADSAVVSFRVVARALQRLPRLFEEEAVLRVERLRFARREAEEGGVEHLDAFQHGLGPDVVRVFERRAFDARAQQLLFGKEGDRLRAFAQALPELFDVARAGEAPRQTDHRDLILEPLRFAHATILKSRSEPPAVAGG